VEAAGAGFCHFPLTRDKEYFMQLCSERIATKHVNGFPQRVWVKSPASRNESLDCRTYALCALHGLFMHGLSLDQHCSNFELMLRPAAERPVVSAYEVIRSKWMS
jgi:phage terminase large subunit GpA-like protein